MSDNKLSPEIFNTPADNLAKLAALFPSAVKDGQLDINVLKEELGQFEEVGTEKYEMTWAGKQEAKKLSQTDVVGRTLKYVPEDSKDADTTQNLYIEGDNLEVLKLLRRNYYGAVKMIYIDPPYNTGNDFVYRDNFAMSKTESDEAEGETVDGERMKINQKSTNRYHANWLNMMYSRLRVSKDLLTNDGVIFISIDDREIDNLKKICNEIFFEHNFIACIVWERAYSPVNLKRHFSESHDFILVYARDIDTLNCYGLKRSDEANDRYSNPDNDLRGDWQSSDLSVGPLIQDKVYEIVTPTGRKVLPPKGYCWRLSRDKFNEYLKDNRIWFGTDGNNVPRIKRFLSETKQSITPMTIWKYTDVGHSQDATKVLKDLFDGEAFFDYPKPGLPFKKAMLQEGQAQKSNPFFLQVIL